MRTAKWTPGPWYAWIDRIDLPVISARGLNIADCYNVTDGNGEASARLIAASPELLEALNSVPSDADYGSAEDFCAAVNDWWLRTASPAIAKATGGLA